MDRFMSSAAARGYRVDFIALHYYAGDFRTPQAVQQVTPTCRRCTSATTIRSGPPSSR
ncbi:MULTISPECIES: hypothetical protein [Streptomyces]|uniref:hypothetical protein n=1 Tax=Streptomyces TaxID=1883 RepID=UPI00224CEEBA|nr:MULTISPECIES: hypothetical protein [Streptomyces]MCX4403868.1 glycoside hydrolase family protein [Streptomyces sp. NBC_01764]MCX4432145.1 glycoside hydrolase family protein [Streptomyces mirabilis]MCX5182907.1 glycoside hydrolase family protein [Streptomyces sp. NBC_00268]